MKKKLIITNIIILLISLGLSISISVFAAQKKIVDSSKKNMKYYSQIVCDDFGNDQDYDEIYNKMKLIDDDIRISFVTKEGAVISDSFCETTENFIHYKEFSNVGDFAIRIDKDQDIKMMYLVQEINDVYVRIGIPYDAVLSGIKDLVWIMLVVSVVIFVIMAIIVGQMVSMEMRPLNAVISGLEEMVGSKHKYNYDSIKDISSKINEVKEHITDNMEKITFEKEKVEFILNNMGQGIIVLDNNYHVIMINKGASDFFSISENYDGVFLQALYNSKISNIDEITKALERNNYDMDFAKDDRIYNLWINKITSKWAIKDEDSKGILMVITDVTEEKVAEEKQKEFFANASHELRSPLTSIIGFQDMICEGILQGDEIIDASKRTIIEGKKMLNLVNNMLDLSALERMKKPERYEDLDIGEITKDIIESLKPQMFNKNVSITENISSAVLVANRGHMDNLLRNLIDNAIKYNKDNGHIDVTVFVDENIVISVKDSGLGMSSEDCKRIFERFYRVDKARSRTIGSSGLGLAIVKQICNIYHADIQVDSKIDEGTTITVKIPLK